MINSAGYVIYDKQQNAIYGTGATADQAWSDAKSNLDRPLNAFDGEPVSDDEWFAGFTVRSASVGLLALVESKGGDISWGYLGGVACTVDELIDDAWNSPAA
jgi:phage terminase large subunit-like protein